MQLPIQLADSVAGLAYSFVVTTLILWGMHYVPFLRLRFDEKEKEEVEEAGIDVMEMGAYAYDFVSLDPLFAQGAGSTAIDARNTGDNLSERFQFDSIQLRSVGSSSKSKMRGSFDV